MCLGIIIVIFLNQLPVFRYPLHVGEGADNRIGKAKILDAVLDFAVFHPERAVAGHPRQNCFGRIDKAIEVMKTRNQNPALHRVQHFIPRFIPGSHIQVQGNCPFPLAVGRQRVAGRLGPRPRGGRAVINDPFGNALVHKDYFLFGHAFEVERDGDTARIVAVVIDRYGIVHDFLIEIVGDK